MFCNFEISIPNSDKMMRSLFILFTLLPFCFISCEKENQPPTCQINSPANNTTYYRGDTVQISITANDPDGTISEVQLYIDNIGITSLETFPYNYEWNTQGETQGQHEIKATAIDTRGGQATSTTNIILEAGLPMVTTNEATDITCCRASSGGSVTNPGIYPVTSKGIVWDTLQNPTIEDNYGQYEAGAGEGDFSVVLEGLLGNKTYYIRAYATNQEGTSYGQEESFTTLNYWSEKGTFTDDRDDQTYNWVKIGDQIWMAENLNIGTLINGTQEQTNNGTIEKYGVDNNTAYCDTFGGLYQWHEMMNYVTTESAQGICPDGWHVPSDLEWKVLEMYLGMTQQMADSAYERGTIQGALLKEGGGSGFEGLQYGARYDNGNISGPGNAGYYWTSKQNPSITSQAVYRILYNNNSFVGRFASGKTLGLSVRCIKNQ
jgi:uncharacterized protein (TIGR02145 family)